MAKADKIVSLEIEEIAAVSGGLTEAVSIGSTSASSSDYSIWEWLRRWLDHPGDNTPVNP